MSKDSFLLEIEKFANGDKIAQSELIALIIEQFSNQITLMNNYLIHKEKVDIKQVAHFLAATFIFLDMKRAIELVAKFSSSENQNADEINLQVKELILICNELIISLKNIPSFK